VRPGVGLRGTWARRGDPLAAVGCPIDMHAEGGRGWRRLSRMRGNPNRRHVFWVLLLCACMASPEMAVADDGPSVTVPDVRRRRIEDAMRIIEAAGLKVGDVYEFSRERILKMFRVRGVLGTVFLQKPTPGTGWPASKPIDLVVVSEKDGKLPADLLGAKRKAATPAKEAPRDTGVVPPNGGVRDDPLPPVPPPADAPPATPRPGDGQPQAAPPKDVPRKDAPVEAAGSPDAPRKAAKADPGRVPEMVGLDLAEAEMLIRDAKMTLHVERVPGHPVGKVLKQMPAGGSKRPPAGAVKVVITAGGDFESPMPAAPAVYVGEITVPGLLDRTKLQAERIVVALGLDVDFREAKRGLAGRVVDQKPAAGQKVAKGGIVTLWIGPGGEDSADCDVPPPLGPIQPGKDGAPGKAEPKKADPKKAPETPKAPLEPGPLAAGVPQLVSPGVNTPIPAGEKVPVGFTWRGVTGASAYILEIEEMGAEGRWMPLARKPARTTAVLMDVERLDPRGTSRLRWRVTAVIGGRHGTASKWVTLK